MACPRVASSDSGQCVAAPCFRAAFFKNEYPLTLIAPSSACLSNGLFPLFHEVSLLNFLFIILMKNAREKMQKMKIFFSLSCCGIVEMHRCRTA